MHETIVCPDCQSQLVLPPTPAGQTVQCPRCERVFAPIPQRAPVAAPRADLYDDETDDVEPSAARLTRPEPLVGEWKATAAMIALAASVLSFGLQIYVGYERIELIQTEQELIEDDIGRRPRMGDRAPDRIEKFHNRMERLERLATLATLIDHLTFWPAAVFFLVWLNQATATVRILQPLDFPHTPSRAVAYFFVPIMNLVWPNTIMQDIWRACNYAGWTSSPGSFYIRAWWLICLAFIGLELTRKTVFGSSSTAQTQVAIAASVCAIIAGVLLIGIIRAIARRQHERYVRLYEDPA